MKSSSRTLAFVAMLVVAIVLQWIANERQRIRDAMAARDMGEIKALLTAHNQRQ